MRHRSWILPACVALLVGLGSACRQQPASPQADTSAPAATRPAQAVRLLTEHLRRNDLAAFARDAVPPPLHGRLETAWREGRTRWPLDEFPLGERLPAMLSTLAASGSERQLGALYDRQFAHADGELKSTAATLGLFGVQYLRNEGDYSDGERAHYTQLVTAASRWGQAAPLSDPARAHAAIPLLATAARGTGLVSAADFARYGMTDSLRRLSPFAASFKQGLTRYGLDIDAGLDTLDTTLESQTGDTARVRMRYRFADTPIDAVVAVERHDGRWYVSDFLRHAETAAASTGAPATPASVADPSTTPPAAAAPPPASTGPKSPRSA